MRPWKIVTVGIWALALACVAAYAVVRVTAPTPAAAPAMPPGEAAVAVTEEGGRLPVMFDTPSFALTDQTANPSTASSSGARSGSASSS